MWFKEASAGGSADAQNIMGLFHYSGKGVKQDFSVAAKYYLMAAEQGHVDSQFMLASLYQRGEGVEQNITEAARWLKAAAIQGDKIALSSLMGLHLNELNVGKEFSKWLENYRKTLETTDADPQFHLGQLYHEGRGVIQDFSLAAELYRQAAERGNKEANLG